MKSAPPKFSSKAEAKLLAEMRKLARTEGRPFAALLDEAIRAYLDKKRTSSVRPQVRKAFAESVRDFDALYRHLAK